MVAPVIAQMEFMRALMDILQQDRKRMLPFTLFCLVNEIQAKGLWTW